MEKNGIQAINILAYGVPDPRVFLNSAQGYAVSDLFGLGKMQLSTVGLQVSLWFVRKVRKKRSLSIPPRLLHRQPCSYSIVK